MRKLIILLLFITVNVSAQYHKYYVSPYTGNDAHSGADTTNAWATWQKAFNTAEAGDTVFFLNGVWRPATTQPSPNQSALCVITPNAGTPIGHDGTEAHPIVYMAYPNCRPILDGSLIVPTTGFNIGIAMTRVDYVQFIGLEIRNIYQDHNYVEAFGIVSTDGTNHHYENVSIHNIGGCAFRWGGAWRYPVGGYPAADPDDYYYPEHGTYGGDTTRFINCDAYDNIDSLYRNISDPLRGGAADGFKNWNEPGSYFEFVGCRAWNCSDDGFDPGTDPVTIMDNCWSWNNGAMDGDGTGFKTGGMVHNQDAIITRILKNCIAANNTGAGFFLLEYEDYYRTNARFYNNISYMNGVQGYYFSTNATYPTVLAQFYNNIAYQNIGNAFSNAYQAYTESHNNWDYIPASFPGWEYTDTVTVTDADFVSLDLNQLDNARQSDGSLPVITAFHLAGNSDLVGAGKDVGLDFVGDAPDIGINNWIYNTDAPDPEALYTPTIYTNSASPVRALNATLGGNVISDGGASVTARGICYSTTTAPDLTDNVITASGTTGVYSVTMNFLQSNTTYYVRAYATNSEGTAYGAEVSFTTDSQTIGLKSGKVMVINGKIAVFK